MIEQPLGPTNLNPFATSLVGLGRLSFLEEIPGQLNEVVRLARETGYHGQIVGPHGSGKTTLTIAIANQLATSCADSSSKLDLEPNSCPRNFVWLVALPTRWFWQPLRFRVQLRASLGRSGLQFDKLPPSSTQESLAKLTTTRVSTLFFVDGVELLSAWRRRAVLAECLGRNFIFTVHDRLAGDLPLLAVLKPSLSLFERLAGQLLDRSQIEFLAKDCRPQVVISKTEIAQAFQGSNGEIRAALASLYELWESKSRRNQ